MDLDIDVPSGFDPRVIFGDSCVRASRVDGNQLIKHPCGVYFESVPRDSATDLAAITFKKADQLGYTKYDFLHLSILDQFTNHSEITELLKREIPWHLLRDRSIVEQLFQLRNSWDILARVQPTNIQCLADVVAMIRPGKRELIEAYIRSPAAVREKLYRISETEDKSSFRRGHAIAYAYIIALQLIKTLPSGES
jgi:DNA polymerase III alpha subunit